MDKAIIKHQPHDRAQYEADMEYHKEMDAFEEAIARDPRLSLEKPAMSPQALQSAFWLAMMLVGLFVAAWVLV